MCYFIAYLFFRVPAVCLSLGAAVAHSSSRAETSRTSKLKAWLYRIKDEICFLFTYKLFGIYYTLAIHVIQTSLRIATSFLKLYNPSHSPAHGWGGGGVGGGGTNIESQELGGGSQSRPTTLHGAGLIVQTASVSFRRRLLLLIYKFLSYLSIFYQ